MSVKTPIDFISKAIPKDLRGLRYGLLAHPASVNSRLKHSLEVLLSLKHIALKAVFGPQHGIYGNTQDNMIEWQGFRDHKTGLPFYSLYGQTRIPTKEMLDEIDVLIVDLQDVGARYYTFIWSMALCMKACEEFKKAMIVFDRPNPVGCLQIEGPVLTPEFASFVGLHPLPVRHAMTIAEIALYLKDRFYPSLSLHVIKMQGYRRQMYFDETKLPWVMPSPNMPTLDTAIVYPGMCLLEGTLLSEGRGTTRPFEIFGAPFIDPDKLVKRLNDYKLKGVVFRAMYFEPTFQKHAGRLCGGAQLHITNRRLFKPFLTATVIIRTVHELYEAYPLWKLPPYEYEYEKMPIDILAGSERFRADIEAGVDIKTMYHRWHTECEAFDKDVRSKYLLYE